MSSSQVLYTNLIRTLSALVSVTHIAQMNNWVWIVVGILTTAYIGEREHEQAYLNDRDDRCAGHRLCLRQCA